MQTYLTVFLGLLLFQGAISVPIPRPQGSEKCAPGVSIRDPNTHQLVCLGPKVGINPGHP
ncbi:hypothetical protein Pst134EA_024289 [Puccinia striiformis f. sp. tritici]|uniref:hypothetical protein n=1 Tax=Puccinia striiformis f. sp. tritici TaxID=168172 RepID=UPI002007EA66|nr:hypothetical protein Pst134EA_024289 [Puccinia striiformis f. sp. tritici]KAH9453414.1 hypothetical protein Pst134EA_024289 [Puccinia striiformis f. sp. tritici]